MRKRCDASPPTAEERAAALLAYVALRTEEDGDCQRWTGYCFNSNHPGGTLFGRKFLVRRALYELAHGPVPPGRVLRCTCETPLCVADGHSEPTTFKRIAQQCGALGLMSGPVRSARIAAAKRAGPQAKISQDEAQAIRGSSETLRVLAARYGISESTAGKIRSGQVRRDFVGNPWLGLGA